MELRCEIKKINVRLNGSIAVMLVAVPDFPDKSKRTDVIVQPYTVIAAGDSTGSWGWIHLELEEKECIGNKMLNEMCTIGTWYSCRLFKVYKFQEQPNEH